MKILHFLSQAISWLDKQGGFTQAVAASLTLVAGGLLQSGFKWCWRAVVRRRRTRAATLELQQADLDADFQKGHADLGIVDHGVVSNTSLEAIKDLLLQSLPAVSKIAEDVLMGDTIHALLADEDARNRQAIAKQLAHDLHSSVRLLESVAARLQPQSAAFAASYRSLLKKPNPSKDERRTLAETKHVFLDGAAVFKQYSGDVATLRNKLAVVEGKQQDLTRMIKRARVALGDIHSSIESVATFCMGELSGAIDKILMT